MRIVLKIRTNVNICKHFANIFVPSLKDMNILFFRKKSRILFSQRFAVLPEFIFQNCLACSHVFKIPSTCKLSSGQIIHACTHTKRQEGL